MLNIRRAGFMVILALRAIPAAAQENASPSVLTLTLAEAVRMALAPRGNIEIDVASESVVHAEALYRQSLAATHPDVSFSLSGQNQFLDLDAQGLQSVRLPIPGYSFPRTAGPFSVLDARFRVTRSLIDVAATRRSDASRAGIETAKMETAEIRDQIAARVARLYLQLQRSGVAVDTAGKLVASAESTLKTVTDRNSAGQALGVDVSHARVRLAAVKQKLMQARLERERAGIALLSSLNRDLNTQLVLTEPLAFIAQPAPAAEEAVATALRFRSEIQTEKRRLDAARLSDVAVHSERLPSLAGYADAGSLGTSVPNSTGTYGVGVSLRIPVFDGGRRDARRSAIHALTRQDELRISRLEKQVEFEVRDALLRFEMARGEVETSRAEEEVAREELDHRTRRFEQGLATQAELTEAQVALAMAADGRTNALYLWNDARIVLMQAMGTVRTLVQ